jgi:hypothetical protein
VTGVSFEGVKRAIGATWPASFFSGTVDSLDRLEEIWLAADPLESEVSLGVDTWS